MAGAVVATRTSGAVIAEPGTIIAAGTTGTIIAAGTTETIIAAGTTRAVVTRATGTIVAAGTTGLARGRAWRLDLRTARTLSGVAAWAARPLTTGLSAAGSLAAFTAGALPILPSIRASVLRSGEVGDHGQRGDGDEQETLHGSAF